MGFHTLNTHFFYASDFVRLILLTREFSFEGWIALMLIPEEFPSGYFLSIKTDNENLKLFFKGLVGLKGIRYPPSNWTWLEDKYIL